MANAIDDLKIRIGKPEGAQILVGKPEGALLVCMSAEEFDPATNILWEDEANKSAARSDVHCSTCKKPVAMSNYLYARYMAMDKRSPVCCSKCLPKLLEVEAEESTKGEGEVT